jgi:hypothetical protein
MGGKGSYIPTFDGDQEFFGASGGSHAFYASYSDDSDLAGPAGEPGPGNYHSVAGSSYSDPSSFGGGWFAALKPKLF